MQIGTAQSTVEQSGGAIGRQMGQHSPSGVKSSWFGLQTGSAQSTLLQSMGGSLHSPCQAHPTCALHVYAPILLMVDPCSTVSSLPRQSIAILCQSGHLGRVKMPDLLNLLNNVVALLDGEFNS